MYLLNKKKKKSKKDCECAVDTFVSLSACLSVYHPSVISLSIDNNMNYLIVINVQN